MSPVPLSVLDLVPVVSGSSVTAALGNMVDLARRAEDFGYHRYWLAEHHLSPGLASASPALLAAYVASATERIRVGSGAVQAGNHSALSIVEQFGILDAFHSGRIDLGLGRSGGKPAKAPQAASSASPPEGHTVDGLYIPPKVSLNPASPAWKGVSRMLELIRLPGAEPPAYTDQVDAVIALLRGTYRAGDGSAVCASPGEGAEPELWVLGSSAGESAALAGSRGLPFAANYHVSPGTVLEAVQAYRDAFRPSEILAEPHVLVSADVVVGPDDETAERLAEPYARWVLGIRSGAGTIPFPSPEDAAGHHWTDEERALVADRVRTQFTGSPETVAEKLGTLRRVTGADELLITTLTHDHEDRVRSYELLAQVWAKQVW